MKISVSLSKYLLISATGFGLGGILWGWECYRGVIISEDTFINPFSFILGAVFMGVIGGIFLFLPINKNIKSILKISLSGILIFSLGFIIAGILSYYLFLYGGLPLVTFALIINVDILKNFINLGSTLRIGSLWAMFLVGGVIIGLFYALFFKFKIWSLIWRGGLGFALGSLISPITGNLLGNLFNSIFFSYLVTFGLIGAILGIFLSWGFYKNQSLKLVKKQET